MQNTIQPIEVAIVEKLKSLNPLKIILFGSYAYGTPNADMKYFTTRQKQIYLPQINVIIFNSQLPISNIQYRIKNKK
jgi:hypothetical protein